LFIGLEIMSISLYVMAGFHRRRMSSKEAAFKYFILGSVASAIFIYGAAMTYGATASTNLIEISNVLLQAESPSGVALVGMVLLVVGLGFKVALVPFQFWTPDVYEGAPTPAVGYMAAVVKCAAFIAMVRLIAWSFTPLAGKWVPILQVLASATLVAGAFLAIAQTNIKRTMAYSSISHAGFITLGIVANSETGSEAVLVYLFAYSLIVFGSFTVISVVGGNGDKNHDLSAYKGLSKRNPVLALTFSVLLFAQAGIPLTSGFLAKVGVIEAVVEASDYWLGMLAMLSAAVVAFAYLRIVLTMYVADDSESAPTPQPLLVDKASTAILTVCVLATLVVGFYPEILLDYAESAILFG
jgi:NADH-quinone oxidoreductase subunit N